MHLHPETVSCGTPFGRLLFRANVSGLDTLEASFFKRLQGGFGDLADNHRFAQLSFEGSGARWQTEGKACGSYSRSAD
jgi:hypothetical protein